MSNYIIIKELPDAYIGTEVIWDESANSYYYEKCGWVSPHQRNYLTMGQVTQTPEYFCKKEEYPDYFAYKNPVYSREEILSLINVCFGKDTKDIYNFEKKLRELGIKNAELILKNKKS